MPVTMRAKILAVEDDPVIRADLRLILEEADFAVSEAREGVGAVERVREELPDLVLLDLGLPKLDGLTTARRILDEHPVPIVALTGRGNSEGRVSALAASVTDVVLKPFGERELVTKLREVLVGGDARAAPSLLLEDEDRLRAMVESMVGRGHPRREIE